jgi:GntR family transcriptional regulator, vanillate catabolism transcriptional regulator
VDEYLKISPVAQRTRLGDEVMHRLREMILSHHLAPGTPLRQTELAEQLGVSRTPLREALRLLENDGLLTVSNRNGTVQVVSVTLENLRDMYQVREVIDGLATRLLALRGVSKETASELKRDLLGLAHSESPYDPALRTELHAKFHAQIAQECGNLYIASFIPLIRTSSAWLHHPLGSDPDAIALVDQGKTYSLGEVMSNTDLEHSEIVDAIEAGDPECAEEAARRHIRSTLTSIEYMIKWQAAAPAKADGPGARVSLAPVRPPSQ